MPGCKKRSKQHSSRRSGLASVLELVPITKSLTRLSKPTRNSLLPPNYTNESQRQAILNKIRSSRISWMHVLAHIPYEVRPSSLVLKYHEYMTNPDMTFADFLSQLNRPELSVVTAVVGSMSDNDDMINLSRKMARTGTAPR